MMERSELRLGNLVFEDETIYSYGINKRVVEMNLDYFNSYSDTWDMIKPIPLTEEWLKKFGFKWKNTGLRLDKYVLRNQIDGWFMYISNESLNFTVHIKYIHQLQNLYFALTGKELTIKETINKQ